MLPWSLPPTKLRAKPDRIRAAAPQRHRRGWSAYLMLLLQEIGFAGYQGYANGRTAPIG